MTNSCLIYLSLRFLIFYCIFAEKHKTHQVLPSTRQRNSLFGVGKNLTNIPDDDPKHSPSNAMKHFKKRFNIGQHFATDADSQEPQDSQQRENKIPRTSLPLSQYYAELDNTSVPQNLSTKMLKESSNLLLDVSTSNETSASLSLSISSPSNFDSALDCTKSSHKMTDWKWNTPLQKVNGTTFCKLIFSQNIFI